MGIGDPLVSGYGRMYLIYVAAKISPDISQYIMKNMQEFLASLKWVNIYLTS